MYKRLFQTIQRDKHNLTNRESRIMQLTQHIIWCEAHRPQLTLNCRAHKGDAFCWQLSQLVETELDT